CVPHAEVGSINEETAACDWWSLGAILFELLTGKGGGGGVKTEGVHVLAPQFGPALSGSAKPAPCQGLCPPLHLVERRGPRRKGQISGSFRPGAGFLDQRHTVRPPLSHPRWDRQGTASRRRGPTQYIADKRAESTSLHHPPPLNCELLQRPRLGVNACSYSHKMNHTALSYLNRHWESSHVLSCGSLAQCHPAGISRHTSLNVPDFLSEEAKSLLQQFNPIERLGAGVAGVEDIKSHPFFARVNWPK
ncbi:hypothetical protein JZ751_004798, partial [Albula glossodonta]